MTAAVHGPRVTQADRDAALDLLQGAAPEGIDDGRHDSLSLVQAFARHREASQAELVEALERIAGYSEVNGMTRIWMRKIARAALAKARTDATGDGA